jgi:hypothetical protein
MGGYCHSVFFSSDDLSEAMPIPEEDREEFALGIALVHYSMNAGIKKFKEKGKAGVTKELIQMHDMNVFCPIEVESLVRRDPKVLRRVSWILNKEGLHIANLFNIFE